jgi:glycosyltransferase involved in cell wall biosynthesis
MKVSVVIPAWNAERYLGAALASVYAQTVSSPLEVIVVDDGSTDGTANVARAFPVRLEQQSHGGAAAARNAGLTLTKGDLIAFLDADDLWLPNKLELQINALEAKPDLSVIFTGIEQFISDDTPEVAQEVHAPLGVQIAPTMSTLVARADVFARTGLFPALQGGDWIAWLGRAERIGIKMQTIPTCLARRRIHRHNLTRTQKLQVHSDYLRLLRTHLREKRSGSA